MVEFNHRKNSWSPRSDQLRRARLRVEAACARLASRAVFCTDHAARIFTDRYPEFPVEHAVVIPNGYDEKAFAEVVEAAQALEARKRGPLRLLHSGVLYPGPDRDPTSMLEALRALIDGQPQWRGRLKVTLRATGYDDVYRPLISRLNLSDVVSLAPMVSYRDALKEMVASDGLLVFQGYTSNPAIPAKVYEYLRAGKPILAMVDAEGETARLLRSEAVGTLVPIDDPVEIKVGLLRFLAEIEAGTAAVLTQAQASRHERGQRARMLVGVMNDLHAEKGMSN